MATPSFGFRKPVYLSAKHERTRMTRGTMKYSMLCIHNRREGLLTADSTQLPDSFARKSSCRPRLSIFMPQFMARESSDPSLISPQSTRATAQTRKLSAYVTRYSVKVSSSPRSIA